MSAEPCPACGPRHDLDAVTCARCGHTEPLPEAPAHSCGPAVVAALERVRDAVHHLPASVFNGVWRVRVDTIADHLATAIAAAKEGRA